MNERKSFVLHFDHDNKAKPILKWAGGKSSILLELFDFFPRKFNRYYEPFLGGGAVFLSLNKNFKNAFINDMNKDIYTLYRTIQKKPNELMLELDKLEAKYSEDFYYELRKYNPETDLKRAARTLFLNKTGFNGLYRLNSKGNYNVPFGKRKKCPALYDKKNFIEVSTRFQNSILTNFDFETIIDSAEFGDFIYCDPPYEPLSVSSSFNSYNSGGFSFLEQERLFNSCKRAVKKGATIIISNSNSPKIIELYKDWDIHKIKVKRMINSKGDGRGKIEEVIIVMKNSFISDSKLSKKFANPIFD
jgi:DNA adenine methylase